MTMFEPRVLWQHFKWHEKIIVWVSFGLEDISNWIFRKIYRGAQKRLMEINPKKVMGESDFKESLCKIQTITLEGRK